jgi:hypothetical protein
MPDLGHGEEQDDMGVKHDDTQTERRAEVNHAQWRAAMKLHGRPKGAPRSTHEGGVLRVGCELDEEVGTKRSEDLDFCGRRRPEWSSSLEQCPAADGSA